MDVYKHPEPVLALALAATLAKSDPDEAVEILKQAAARCDDSSIPVRKRPVDTIVQMKFNAARYLIDAERERGYDDTAMPPSESLCKEAVGFYLSLPEADFTDFTVMRLCYELAEHLHSLLLYGHAMDVCIWTLDMATRSFLVETVSRDVLKDFGTLINQVKATLAHYISDIKEDMQEGGEEEHSRRPWAELPRLEKESRRAVEARRLCNQVWGYNVSEDFDMVRYLPVDWTSEDGARVRDDFLGCVVSRR